MISLFFFSLACGSQSTERNTQAPQREQNTQAPQRDQAPSENLDQGQKHPPIPENNPVWEWDAGGFVPDFGWYGEHNWMDVRMRVSGHLSAGGRDIARLHATTGNLEEAAKSYQKLHQILVNIPSPQSGYSAQINSLLINAAKRDHNRILAISTGNADQLPKSGKIGALRDRYYELSLRHDAGQNVEKEAKELQADLQAQRIPRPELKIDEFKDFTDRHKLRVRLFDAYLDSLDPLAINERWGYWQPVEIDRQIVALGFAATKLGGEDWSTITQSNFQKTPVIPNQQPSYMWPSLIVAQLASPDQKLDLSPEEFGRLPTGDTLIDVAGHPGPKGIGTLMKWGLDDKKHREFLSQTAESIGKNMAQPETAVQIAQTAIAKLNSATHGSKFYNVKQLRNATVRQLARAKHYAAAYTLFQDNFPLHHQDWACPNRQGLLLAVARRLLASGRALRASGHGGASGFPRVVFIF